MLIVCNVQYIAMSITGGKKILKKNMGLLSQLGITIWYHFVNHFLILHKRNRKADEKGLNSV